MAGKMRPSWAYIYGLGVAFFLVCSLVACTSQEEPALSENVLPPSPISAAPPQETVPIEQLVPEVVQEPTRIHLLAVGDNLLHLPIIRWCRNESGYDFSPLYREIADLVQSADVAFVNQETPLGGPDSRPSGYPTFNTPQEAGLALIEAGFDIVSQATNHALDQGAAGLLTTADFWAEQTAAQMIGINRNAEERAQITVTETAGCRFAWLAYSYGTNGMPMQYAYLLNLIDREAITADIAAAQTQADAVIVSMHWGDEYSMQPNAYQRELAQFLADQGVALVIGHHPHVIQPLEWLEGQAGNRTLVAYSLGNFVSNQARRSTMLEGMLSVTFRLPEKGGMPEIEGAGIIPLVMHYESPYTNYCVYPLYRYTDELASQHYINQLDQKISLEWLQQTATEIWADLQILDPQQTFPAPLRQMPQTLAAGGTHALALQADGSLWGWGSNQAGELRESLPENLLTPQNLAEQDIHAISAGSRHSLELKVDGSLWTWGRNHQGQLGTGSRENSAQPQLVLPDVIAVSSSDWHSLALQADGSLWAWGYNAYGQLGDGSRETHLSPVKVLDGVRLICAGRDVSAAVKEDGSLWTWGRNQFGQLGNGNTEDSLTPIMVMEQVVSVSLRDWHGAAVKTDGSLWLWGRNQVGQLGDGSRNNSPQPIQVLAQVAAVSVGRNFTLALRTDGALLSWGDNSYGQLGAPTGGARLLPRQILDKVVEVCAGDYYALVRRQDGTVWGWGDNSSGQLGNGGTANQVQPQLILE